MGQLYVGALHSPGQTGRIRVLALALERCVRRRHARRHCSQGTMCLELPTLQAAPCQYTTARTINHVMLLDNGSRDMCHNAREGLRCEVCK